MAKYNWHLSRFLTLTKSNFFVKIELKKLLDRPFEEYFQRQETNLQGFFILIIEVFNL